LEPLESDHLALVSLFQALSSWGRVKAGARVREETGEA